MIQFYAVYTDWEDYQNEMYITDTYQKDVLINKSIELLSDSDMFLTVCKKVVKEWPVSTAVNLTNINCNRRAWLGQAACCFNHGSTELMTREAWGEMEEIKRIEANIVADKIIRQFELNYEKKDIAICF